jgi:hypothetical protein
MEKPYILQHKNTAVAVLMIDDTGDITDIGDAVNKPYLPVLCSENISLKTWWSNRTIPVTRRGIAEDLMGERISSTKELLLRNLALSLTDCYWVKPLDSDYTWEQVNLFDNLFRDSFISMDVSGDRPMDLTNASPFIPSSSLQGELQKKWIILEDERILVKGNYDGSLQQSLNEVFVSGLHERQDRFPFVSYWLTELMTSEGETVGCACRNFCDKHTEFVSAYEIAYGHKKRNDQSEYEAYIEFASRQEIELRPFMEYQIATDFILTNTDRHFNNFGMLRDSDSLKLLGPAPIFDNGNCLFYRGHVPKGKGLYDISVTSFRKRETDLLKYVTQPDIVDIKALPKPEELYTLLKKDEPISDMRRQEICEAYEAKIRMYIDFMNGTPLWEYQYRK